MVKVQLEDKDFTGGNKYFNEGVYKVYLSDPKRDVSKSGSEFIQFTVNGENEEQTDVRLYLTEKAAPYSLKTLAGIAVHNKGSEAEREKVREAFKAITDTDTLDAKFLAKFENYEAWVLVEEDTNAPKPNGGYYLRTNLYSFPPKPRKITPEDIMGGGTKDGIDPDEVPFGA